MRETSDGLTLIAIKRGNPPDCPEGYYRDSNDPYRFHKILSECEHRNIKILKRNCCGGDKEIIECNVIQDTVTKKICHTCKANEEWITNYQKKYG